MDSPTSLFGFLQWFSLIVAIVLIWWGITPNNMGKSSQRKKDKLRREANEEIDFFITQFPEMSKGKTRGEIIHKVSELNKLNEKRLISVFTKEELNSKI